MLVHCDRVANTSSSRPPPLPGPLRFLASAYPGYLTRDDVEEGELEREREIYRAQMKDKPAHILDKIVEGKLKKFYSERCLMEQPFIKNPDITVIEYAKQKIAELGENIVIRRFIRYAVGEDA